MFKPNQGEFMHLFVCLNFEIDEREFLFDLLEQMQEERHLCVLRDLEDRYVILGILA